MAFPPTLIDGGFGDGDSWAALGTILAAATYLFDAGSNAATAYKYYEYYHQRKEGADVDEIGSSINAGHAFIGVLSLMFVAHITNVIVFYMALEPKDRPVGAAYFLPLIHLKILVEVVRRTSTVKGFKDLTSPESASLYNILAAALETGPQLFAQYIVLHLVGSNCTDTCKLPKVLVISIIGSLISGAYNTGAAIVPMQSEATFRTRLGIGIASGVHTLCALVVRSFAISFLATGTPIFYFVTYACVGVLVRCGLTWAFTKPNKSSAKSCCHWRTVLHSIAYGHVSLTIGPLYPFSRDAHQRSRRGQSSFHVALILATMVHLMLEVIPIIIAYKAAFYKQDGAENYAPPCISFRGDVYLPCTFFLALFSLGISLYIVYILAYVIIDKHINSHSTMDT